MHDMCYAKFPLHQTLIEPQHTLGMSYLVTGSVLQKAMLCPGASTGAHIKLRE